MKAPDKIYLQTCGDCPGLECESCQFQDLAEVSWCEDKIFDTDKEYIRKDALLEWAKECFRLQDKGSRYSKGVADAFSKVINKLDSM